MSKIDLQTGVPGQLTDYATDKFVAQGYSRLTMCLAKPVGPDHPSHKAWLTGFVLNSILGFKSTDSARALAFAILRRAEGAVADFDEACAALAEFVQAKTASGYFRALRRFESSIAQVHQALDFIRKARLKRKDPAANFFQVNDGSDYQRLNEVYNVARHEDPETLPHGDVQLAWLENDGIHVTSASLHFTELHDIVAELARLADHISVGGPWSGP